MRYGDSGPNDVHVLNNPATSSWKFRCNSPVIRSRQIPALSASMRPFTDLTNALYNFLQQRCRRSLDFHHPAGSSERHRSVVARRFTPGGGSARQSASDLRRFHFQRGPLSRSVRRPRLGRQIVRGVNREFAAGGGCAERARRSSVCSGNDRWIRRPPDRLGRGRLEPHESPQPRF